MIYFKVLTKNLWKNVLHNFGTSTNPYTLHTVLYEIITIRLCNCSLGEVRSADGGIHATRDHSNVRSVLQITKRNCIGQFRIKGVECWHQCSAPPSQCESAYSCLHSSTAGAFQLGDVWPPSLQRFNNNELMEGVKTWLSSQAADSFNTGIQELIPQ
jgi:hypothetical protein